MDKVNRKINRRQFITSTASKAGMVVLALQTADGLARAASKEKGANPFAYDVERLAKTDPKLIAFDPVRKFSAGDREPRRISVGPDGRLYIAGKNGLTILTPEGGRDSEIPLPEPARCVAVAGDGTIYLGLRGHVEVFDRKGQRLKSWDTPGKKTWLSGLVVSENDLFAADSGNRLVLRYDRSGKINLRIGEKNKEREVPGLIVPSPYLDVELAKDGLLRVNNPGRHRVETYTPDGDLELAWGRPSAAIEGFCGCCNPIALAVLPDGSCLTCEKGLPRAKIHSADGTFQCVVAGPESFPENSKAGSGRGLSDGSMAGLDAAIDKQGSVYLLDVVTATIHVMNRKAGV